MRSAVKNESDFQSGHRALQRWSSLALAPHGDELVSLLYLAARSVESCGLGDCDLC